MVERIQQQNHTIREQMEQLVQSQHEFTAITENMSEGFLLVSTHMEVMSGNHAAFELLKMDDSRQPLLLRKACREPQIITAAESALAGIKDEAILSFGTMSWQMIATPVSSDGHLSGAVILLLDVTERTDREALRREFSANVSHELKTSLTTGKWVGLLTGLGVTAIIQSSSATTVMVVGFVNSGLMTLTQVINVIMGANIGTTVTAWILSLSGLESSNLFVHLLKPSSFTPLLALVGVIFYMTARNSKRKDTGTILLGFATLMFGMETMSSAVAGLKNVPAFANILVMFRHPVLGVAAGALLTAIIQSSSASVGILQALPSTGQVTVGAAIPIIMKAYEHQYSLMNIG